MALLTLKLMLLKKRKARVNQIINGDWLVNTQKQYLRIGACLPFLFQSKIKFQS